MANKVAVHAGPISADIVVPTTIHMSSNQQSCWRLLLLSAVGCCLLLAPGCSRTPRRIKAPSVDPQAAGRQALELYDKNADGSLDVDELAACPAIREKLSAYDTDGNGAVSAAEVTDRIAGRTATRIGLTRIKAMVTLNGRALPDAEVVFEPEPFLGGDVKPAFGTTRRSGATPMAIRDEDLPDHYKGRKALQMGTYKVRITHPEIDIPARYNTETELGVENEIGQSVAAFDLKISNKN